jgi:excisionase family DNA binding protein
MRNDEWLNAEMGDAMSEDAVKYLDELPVDKQILTTQEAAEFLGISRWQMLALMERGHVRRLRGLAKPFRVSRSELERYLQEGVVA